MATRLFGLLVALASGISAAQRPDSQLAACAPEEIALSGFDVVSYYAPNGPVRGAAAYRVEFGGLTFLFANAENRDRFIADPKEFLPDYGGWCAATLAHGALLCPDSSNFKIEHGRLLLFEVSAFTNGRALWDSDPGGYRERADRNFKRLIGE